MGAIPCCVVEWNVLIFLLHSAGFEKKKVFLYRQKVELLELFVYIYIYIYIYIYMCIFIFNLGVYY